MKKIIRTEDGKLELVENQQQLVWVEPDEVMLKVSLFRVSDEDLCSQTAPGVGSTAIGEVVKVGDNVTNIQLGTIVVALLPNTAAADYVCIEPHMCCELPKSLNHNKALLSGVVSSYYLLLTQTLGIGPVGGVVAISRGGSDRDIVVGLCNSLGISIIPIEATFNEVMEQTSGLGVSAVICLGELDAAELVSLSRMVSARGKYVFMSGGTSPQLLYSTTVLDILSAKSASLTFHSLSSWLLSPDSDSTVSHILIEAVRILSQSDSFQASSAIAFQSFVSSLPSVTKAVAVSF
eukprot:TRINITY_DN16005_c0_g1_i1.p1 TRINITY_DN16005_c0_g1~~TRINITY_DN16005_c0_g1_i1.p1  ORF type:complete len:292 (+),score=59.71 TRINITY_DN16005_c0_g1_i1:44-919(+)